MTYQEMVDALVSMDERDRRETLKTYWQSAFRGGFIAFVQGQVETPEGTGRPESRGGQLDQTADVQLPGAAGESVEQHESGLCTVAVAQ